MYYTPHDASNESQLGPGRIFLGRLREDVDREALYNALSKYGNVLDMRIVSTVKDNYRKRFAFCDFDTVDSATRAIENLRNNTDLGFPLVATLSTDTKPSPTWNSAAASTNYYRPSSPITPANTTSYKQQSIGSNRSAYGLAWQPSQNSTIVVTPPPPPPPPPGNKNRSSASIATRKNSPIESISSSVSNEDGGGGGTVHRTPFPPASVAAAVAGAAATPPAPSAPHQEAGEYSFPNQGYVPVPPHVMQHPLPTGPAMHAMPHLPPVIAPPAFENGQITTLYIRNIPLNMNELGLLHFYMPFGAIVATKILRNLDSMRSRGAGFVEFFTRKESDAALKATHKTASPDGRELLVQYAPRQLHMSRGAAAMAAPPVWPVMPYPAVAAPHVAVAPLGPQSDSVAPVGNTDTSAPSAAAVSIPVATVQPPSADAAGTQALALGHPVHPQAGATAAVYPGQQSYTPYNQMMPYHPAHLTGIAPAPAAPGWQHPQQQRYGHSYYPQQYYPQHYYPGSHSTGNVNTNAPTSAAATMPPAGSKPASSGDSAGSVTSSTTAVRRPGDPVVVVYGNHTSQKQQQQQQPLPFAFHPGHYAMPPYSTTTGYSTTASGYRANTVNAGGRYPLRNLSNMNKENGNSQPQSAGTTPEGVMPLGVQKHIAGSGGVGLDGSSGDQFPSSLSPSAMEAICSRVRAAARDVNDANAAARAMNKKPPALSIDVETSGNSSQMSGNVTPDLVVKSNNNVVSSANTVESQNSLESVADSVASCATGGKNGHCPAEVDVAVSKN